MDKMKRLGLLGTLLLTMLAACAPVQNSQSVPEKQLTIGDTQFTAGIDPAHDWDGWFTVRFGIGETLFKLSRNLEIEPWLAESYQKIDDHTWKIQLKEGITFSNGKAMDSQAVIASLERLADKHIAASWLKNAQYSVEDARAFVIQTQEPSPTLINELSDTKTAIVDTTVTDEIIGTGPFKVAKFTVNDSIDLDANMNYWQGTPHLQSVHYQYIPDPKTLALAIIGKQIDGGVDLADDVIDSFKNDQAITTYQQESSRAYHLELSQERIPDVRVRQAILAAIDKQAITKDLLQDRVTPTNGAFPSSSLFGQGDFKNQFYQPEKSQQLLAEAGYQVKNSEGILENEQHQPLTIKLKTYKRLNNEKIATALQAQLRTIGVDLQVEVSEKVDGLSIQDYDIALASAVTIPMGEPYYFLQASLGSNGTLNYVGNTNTEIDDELQLLHKSSVLAEQQHLVQSIEEQVRQLAVVDYIGFVHLHAAMNQSVQNFQLSPTDYYQMNYEMDKQ